VTAPGPRGGSHERLGDGPGSRGGLPGASTRETVLVVLGAVLLALVFLRAGPSWKTAVVGNYDAWQGLWNLDHVDRVLRGDASLWASTRVWAPEGTSLVLHALSPALTVPGALLARATGPFLAYDLLVVLCLALSAAAFHRLARRVGASPAGAAAGAFVCGFSPLLTARVAAGHLNLLPLGFVAVALEGLVVALSTRGAASARGVAGAALALAAVLYCDYYLALLALLAVGTFSVGEFARPAWARSRGAAAAVLAFTAIASLALSAPLLGRLHAELGGGPRAGHDPANLSVDAAALLDPVSGTLLGRAVRGLDGPLTPPEVEKIAYLGLVPLAALAWALARSRCPLLSRAAVAGGVAALVSLGPSLVVAGRDTGLPMAYGALVSAFPALQSGGGANRFLLLALLPLGLGVSAAATRLLARRTTGRIALAVAGGLVLLADLAPADPGSASFPLVPPDPAMVAVKEDPATGAVLDVDPGIPSLYRQLRHGRAQTFGYLSRVSREAFDARLRDPLLGPLLDPSRPTPDLPAIAAAFHLRERWGIGFVVGPDVPPWRERAARLGFPLLARSEGLSVAYRLPGEPPPRLAVVDLSQATEPLRGRGAFLEGLHEPEALPFGAGRWTEGRATLFFPASAGEWLVTLAAPRPEPVPVRIRWGPRKESRVPRVWDLVSVSLTVEREDLTPGGGLLVTLESPPLRPAGERRELGVFLMRLEKRG